MAHNPFSEHNEPVELDASTRRSSSENEDISLRPLRSIKQKDDFSALDVSSLAETLDSPLQKRTKDVNPFSDQNVADAAKRRRPHILLNWWQEATAWLLAFAAFMALFGTMYSYAGRPSPNWPKWISLNTIIALYIVIIKIGILLVTAEGLGQLKWVWFSNARARPLTDLVKFDDATRGPFGAMGLLRRLGIADALSSLAALIIVLALALDPFAQQIVDYYDCSIPVHGAAAVLPRTNYFYQEGATHTGALLQSIVPGVQAAVNAGIFSPNTAPDATCSTGNCTWVADYTTVAFCSSCEDLSSELVFLNTTYAQMLGTMNTTTYNISTYLPGSLFLNMSESSYGDQEFAAMGVPGNVTGGMDYRTTLDFVLAKDIQGNIDPSTGGNFTDCNITANADKWHCKGYGASRCQIYPCVKTYNATVEAGKLTETALETASTDIWGYNTSTLTLATLDTHCITADERTQLLAQGYRIDSSKRFIGYNLTTWLEYGFDISTNTTFPQSLLLRNCIYGIDLTFLDSISMYLESLFTGSIYGPLAYGETERGLFTGPQVLQSIFNFGNVDFDRVASAMQNVSLGLTNYMRSNGAQNLSSDAIGAMSTSKTCIRMRWGWLAYPISLLMATLLFFVLMILETRPTGGRPEIWKSSPLALLYHGLVHKGESEEVYLRTNSGLSVNTARDLGGMHRMARGTAVKLSGPVHNVAHFEIQSQVSVDRRSGV